MPKTQLTKNGVPVQGTKISVRLADGDMEDARVVGKAYSLRSNAIPIFLILEWSDGVRQSMNYLDNTQGQDWDVTTW